MSTKPTNPAAAAKITVELPNELAPEDAVMLMRFREALDDGIRKRARQEPAAPPKTIYDLKSLG